MLYFRAREKPLLICVLDFESVMASFYEHVGGETSSLEDEDCEGISIV